MRNIVTVGAPMVTMLRMIAIVMDAYAHTMQAELFFSS